MKDLKGWASSHNGDSYWIDKYAEKIDKLPILHVDDELLVYGQNLYETLHIMSGARKAANLQGGAAERSALGQSALYSTGNGYGYGAYSYPTPKSREADAGNARANAAASGTAVKLQGWTLIDEATLSIRQVMTKRYDTEF